MIYAFKKPGESNERLLGKIKKLIARDHLLPRVKMGKFHQKPKTKRQVRVAAIMRENYRAKRERAKHYSN